MSKKYELDSTPAKRAFKAEIEKVYGEKSFTVLQGKEALKNCGHPESKWDSIYLVLRKACNAGRGIYSIAHLDSATQPDSVVSNDVTKEEKQKILKSDMAIINEEKTKNFNSKWYCKS